jgi:hypothetical protein
MQWAGGHMDGTIEGLSPRQRQILAGAYVWDRPAIGAGKDV